MNPRLRLRSARSYTWKSQHSQVSYHFTRREWVEVNHAGDWEWLTSGAGVTFDEDPVLGERLLGRDVAARFDSGEAKRLLVCRGRGLGDVLLLIPALREWQRRYPESTVGVAVDRGYRRFLSGVAHHTLDYEEAYELAPWDVVANLNYYAERSSQDTVAHRSVVFGQGLGLDNVGDLKLECAALPEMRKRAREMLEGVPRPWLALQTEASTPTRCPPPTKMIELADALSGLGSVVALGGGVCVPPGVRDWQDLRDVELVAGVLSEADVVVGLDSGLTHLGNALGTKCVALFGPGDPGLRVGGQPRCLPVPLWGYGLCESPCRDHRPPTCLQRPRCLIRFPVEVVVEAVRGQLCRQ